MRLRDYHEKTRPVLDTFRRKEYVITVDATRTPAEVQAEIRAKLGLPRDGDVRVGAAAGGVLEGVGGSAGDGGPAGRVSEGGGGPAGGGALEAGPAGGGPVPTATAGRGGARPGAVGG